jgi:hypothetical protein
MGHVGGIAVPFMIRVCHRLDEDGRHEDVVRNHGQKPVDSVEYLSRCGALVSAGLATSISESNHVNEKLRPKPSRGSYGWLLRSRQTEHDVDNWSENVLLLDDGHDTKEHDEQRYEWHGFQKRVSNLKS